MNLAPGSLVVHEFGGAVGWRLFAIVGGAKPDQSNKPRVMIQALVRQVSHGRRDFTFMHPIVTAVSSLTSLSDYGMKVEKIVVAGDEGYHGTNYLNLVRDDSLVPTKTWGRHAWATEIENHAAIYDDELANLIRKHWLSGQRAEAA